MFNVKKSFKLNSWTNLQNIFGNWLLVPPMLHLRYPCLDTCLDMYVFICMCILFWVAQTPALQQSSLINAKQSVIPICSGTIHNGLLKCPYQDC